MELLERLVTVELERLLEPATDGASPSSSSPSTAVPIDDDLTLHPRQSLRFRLSLRFDADSEAKTQAAVTFLSQIGEARLEEAWSLLFDRLTLSPFLLSGRAAAIVAAQDEEDEAGNNGGSERASSASSFSSAPTGQWSDPAPGATQRPTLPSLALDGIALAPTPVPAAALPGDRMVRDSPAPKPQRGAAFAFGAQGFWLARTYQEGSGAAARSDAASSASPVPAGAAGAGMLRRTSPRSHNGGFGAFSVSERGVEEDEDEDEDEDCLVAGPAITASAYDVVVTPAATPEVAALAHRLSIPSAMVIPRSISSHYVIEYMVPDETLWMSTSSRSCPPRALAFVLLMPLHRSDRRDRREDDYFVIRRVLSRTFVHPMSACFPANYLFTSAPLGCCYVPVHVRRALACESVAYPLSNDQLLLSLSITNLLAAPVRLQSVSLDLYSTHESQAAPSGLSWGATRPAAQGHDRRLIDLLTRLVTVTPMIVSNDRPPFTLQAEETYSFQCILQVVPEFNYVLNPSSLEHVYQRLCRERDAAAEVAASAHNALATGSGGVGDGGAPRVVQPGQTTSATSTALRDDDGVLVSMEDAVKVMSGTYQSYMFVYYRVGDDAVRAGGMPPSTVSGLHLRHPVQWSFGI